MAHARRSLTARVLGAAVLAGALGVALGGCGGSDSSALGHRACVDVASSLRTFAAASNASSAEQAAVDRARALDELRRALQPAALAASDDGQWQALEATLSESSRVREALLVTALSAQCAETLSE